MSQLAATVAGLTNTATAARPCRWATLLAGLDQDDRDAITAALDGQVSPELIAAAAQTEGHLIGATTIRRHEAGQCLCPRKDTTA